MKIILPAILEGLTSRADRTWRITFGTRELKGSEVERLNGVLRQEVAILVALDESLIDKYDHIDIDEVQLDTEAGEVKSPSQRLRNCLYIFWQQQGSKGEFDSFYKEKMNNIIQLIKDKLE